MTLTHTSTFMKPLGSGLGLVGVLVLATACGDGGASGAQSGGAPGMGGAGLPGVSGAVGAGTNGGGTSGGTSSSATGGAGGGTAGGPGGGMAGAAGGTTMMGEPSLNLRGRITDRSGKGIASCMVTLGSATTSTLADGAFVLAGKTKLDSAEPAANAVAVACRGYLTKRLVLRSFDEDLGTTKLLQPNILVLYADDMTDWTSLTDPAAVTPNLQALANSGVSFSRAHVPAQECNPSRTAVMLGRRPSSTGMYNNSHFFRRDSTTAKNALTMPKFFEGQGYETVYAGKIFHDYPPNPPNVPPETWSRPALPGGDIGVPKALTDNPWHHGDFGPGDYNTGSFFFGPTSQKDEETGEYKAAVAIARFIDQEPHDKPFFAAWGGHKPHAPLIAPQKYFDLYPLDKIKLPMGPADDLDDVPTIGKGIATDWGKFPHKVVLKYNKWAEAVQAYQACASYFDNNLGVIVRALDASVHKDNTIVVFMSDHGVHLGSKDHWWKITLWNETTHIPFVLRVPGVTPAGAVSPRTVNTLDLYPTLLDLLNFPPDPALDGRSIAPLLKDPKAPWAFPTLTTSGYRNHSVVSERYRYTRYSDGGEELYDEEKDPHEYKNLVGSAEAGPVIADLKQWLPKADAPAPVIPAQP